MSPPNRRVTQAVYTLPLKDDGSPDVDGSYLYLPPPTEPPYILRFLIEGTSSICRKGSLWTNLPGKDQEFERSKYVEHKLTSDFHRTTELDFPIYQAGSFDFRITYTPLPEFTTDDQPSPKPTETPNYYIDVSPRLTLHRDPLPLEALSIFSVISKFMGPYPEDWNKHLRGIGARGYNMVHFTPLMQRGDSNSPYSIYDQLAFDNTVFKHGEKDVADMVQRMENQFGLLGLTDVVWNHTANNSKWLEAHPEAGYSPATAPHLTAALELDTALLDFGRKLASYGLPTTLQSVDDLLRVMEGVKSHVISALKLWEYYVCDVDADVATAVERWSKGKVTAPAETDLSGAASWSPKQKADWTIEHALAGGDRMGERFRRKIKPDAAAALLQHLVGEAKGSQDQGKAKSTMLAILNDINVQFYREYDADVAEIMEQVFNRIKYVRLDDNGPKLGPIDDKNPLVETYFTRLPHNATTKKHDPAALALVNNGWIWAADAMRDNAGPQSKAYLRREVIVWSDCVKLRYGSGPKDNPYLWDHMARYTRLMAKYFHAFRIDNCHSTPIHLAEYMLDEARKVRPNLAVMAELFTGSEEMDYKFVQRLGISCLIREAMQCWSTQEMSRLVHRHGGIPIGSFVLDDLTHQDRKPSSHSNGNGVHTAREVIHRIRPSPVHALFMDCTHDNEVPAQKRDARDTLPNAALVAMCNSSIGSVMGYDEIYPSLIELVHETRRYTSPYSNQAEVKVGPGENGIGNIKKLMNQIHTLMGKDGYEETYIHHDNEYITVHRVHPQSRKGYFLIAHTAYPGYGNGNGGFPATTLPGTRANLIGSWMLEVENSAEQRERAMNDEKYLRGLPSRLKDIHGVECDQQGDDTVIKIPSKFPPGSIAMFETWVPGADHSEGLDKFVTSGGRQAFAHCNLIDINFLLYRCEPEERDSSDGQDGVYSIPGHGALVYCGLQGWWSVLKDVIRNNDLGHPVCNHLREGQWALDYIVGRMERMAAKDGYKHLAGPTEWLKERFNAIRKVPNFLLPRYFALVIQTAYNGALDRAIELMSDNVRHGQSFLQSLALVSYQVTGRMSNASLWPEKVAPSMAAGLPHFASSWARCWGRDIFISMRGLYLGTGRFADAREHILAFASVLKHGMIPNLLSNGSLPRYNARDSIWFFLQNIQDYTLLVPHGKDLLKESVKRRFTPYNDEWFPHDSPKAYSQSSTIEDVIQEALQRHASGIHFREYNAGPAIDSQMSDKGFNIDIEPDWETGMLFGGNQHNCGTWMDKMGESERAGSKGVPGTPRDGAAVEITGMLYSTLRWVQRLHKEGHYAHDGVTTGLGPLTFKAWADKIAANFEKCYYVPLTSAEDKKYDVDPSIVNRRGIYKDLYRSGKPYEDYQLRPNFPIAMTVAPDLFDPKHALGALAVADRVLRGPCGMATLDPSDQQYRPYYINSEDSDDFATSKGRNYHQGPEWLWPTGFFLRALLKFDLMRRKSPEERVEAFQQVTKRLAGCKRHLAMSPWAGLTELQQKDGDFCGDSCPTQSWSASCLIDLYHDAAVASGGA